MAFFAIERLTQELQNRVENGTARDETQFRNWESMYRGTFSRSIKRENSSWLGSSCPEISPVQIFFQKLDASSRKLLSKDTLPPNNNF